MGFLKREKGKSRREVKEQKISEEDLIGYLKLRRWRIPEGYAEVESYPLKPPFSYVCIVQNEDTAEYLYLVDELPLSREEREAYERVRNILEYELKAPNQTKHFRSRLKGKFQK